MKSGTVKLYQEHGPRRRWFVAWPSSQGRQLKAFTDPDDASAFAKDREDELKRGQIQQFTLAERQELNECHNLLNGRSLVLAVSEWCKARDSVPNVPLVEIVEDWKNRNIGVIPKTIPEMLPEFLADKQQDGLSLRWLDDLQDRLGRFAAAFACPMGDLTARIIDEWLRLKKELTPRSRQNYRTAIGTLSTWAKAKGYLSNSWAELAKISIGRTAKGKVHVLTPDQLRTLLSAANSRIRPWVAIAAFAGVRSAEIRRLTWKDISPDFITISAGNAKTASRRLVPVLPVLTEWLRINPPKELTRGSYQERAVMRVARSAGVKWHANVLRHSFCSYRLAAIQSADQVALEAGNSPAIIFADYRELVTPQAAAEWFNVLPSVTI